MSVDCDISGMTLTDALEPQICFVMGEFGLGIDVPDEVFENPLVRTMEDCSNDIVVLSNVRSNPALSP